MHVRLAGIGMSDFDHRGGIQTDLFCEIDDRGAQSSDRRDLSVAIDAVRVTSSAHTALSFGRQSPNLQRLVPGTAPVQNEIRAFGADKPWDPCTGAVRGGS